MTETNMNASNPYRGDRVPGSVGHRYRRGDPHRRPGEHRRTAAGRDRHDRGTRAQRLQGLLQMPEKTASEFRADGFFITGDLGHIDPHGYSTSSAGART